MDKYVKKEKRKILQFWFYHNKSSKYLISLNNEINDILNMGAKYNYLGKSINFQKIRVIYDRNFSIFYKIKHNEILVVAIYDNQHNPENLTIDF